jgi:hypothetical protein
MKKLIVCCALIIALIVVSGCAGISTYPARSNEPRGIRVYPQKIYLLVGDNKSKFVSLPDVKNGYDIKPWSFLSKHEFNIKIEEAQLKELTSNQDTTAALSLVQKIVELAAKAAEPGIKAMPVIEFESSIGFKAGIYELSETGLFKKVSP